MQNGVQEMLHHLMQSIFLKSTMRVIGLQILNGITNNHIKTTNGKTENLGLIKPQVKWKPSMKHGARCGVQLTLLKMQAMLQQELENQHGKTIQNSKTQFRTDVNKNARKHIDNNLNIKKDTDSVYNSYRFPFVYSNFKNVIKNLLTKGLVLLYTSDSGLQYIRRKIKNLERTTISYKNNIKTICSLQ